MRWPDVTASPGPANLTFLRADLPDATVDRIKHQMAGDFVGAYRIAAKAAALAESDRQLV